MYETYVTKIYRQRSSLVTSIPMEVRNRIGLLNCDHLVWQVNEGSNFVQISKVVVGGTNNVGDSGTSDRKTKGRGT